MAASTRDRPARGARRVGYVVSVVVNAALLVAVNGWPGWEVLPFLTADTRQVLGLVNASILLTLAVNLVYIVSDPRWLRALGDLITTMVSIVVTVRIWQVFPFDFAGSAFDWGLVARILLGLAIGGSVIAAVVALVTLVRATASPSDRGARSGGTWRHA